MANYCTVEDVLRVLGGTLETVQASFDKRLWEDPATYPVTPVVVDLNTFDVPDTILARIASNIVDATSRIDAAVFAAYKAQPTNIPGSFKNACAKIAAHDSANDDGVRTKYLREQDQEVKIFFDRIAKWELDLGIEAPRPDHRTPAVGIVNVGGGSGSRRARRGRCCVYPGGCC
jgi:phage gp36-like protein